MVLFIDMLIFFSFFDNFCIFSFLHKLYSNVHFVYNKGLCDRAPLGELPLEISSEIKTLLLLLFLSNLMSPRYPRFDLWLSPRTDLFLRLSTTLILLRGYWRMKIFWRVWILSEEFLSQTTWPRINPATFAIISSRVHNTTTLLSGWTSWTNSGPLSITSGLTWYSLPRPGFIQREQILLQLLMVTPCFGETILQTMGTVAFAFMLWMSCCGVFHVGVNSLDFPSIDSLFLDLSSPNFSTYIGYIYRLRLSTSDNFYCKKDIIITGDFNLAHLANN